MFIEKLISNTTNITSPSGRTESISTTLGSSVGVVLLLLLLSLPSLVLVSLVSLSLLSVEVSLLSVVRSKVGGAPAFPK